MSLLPKEAPGFKPSRTRIEAIEWMNNPKNREIMGLFDKFVMRAYRDGRERFGIRWVCERVRWEVNVEWSADYKIANDKIPYISRRLIARYPQLDGKLRCKLANDELKVGDIVLCP